MSDYDVQGSLDRIEEKVDTILEIVTKAGTSLNAIVDQVAPAIQALEKSPLFKMLGGKK